MVHSSVTEEVHYLARTVCILTSSVQDVKNFQMPTELGDANTEPTEIAFPDLNDLFRIWQYDRTEHGAFDRHSEYDNHSEGSEPI